MSRAMRFFHLQNTVARLKPLGKILIFCACICQGVAQPGKRLAIDLKQDDVIVFAGGTNIANMRKDGYLETLLLAQYPQTRLHIWNLGWDGDTVYEQFRDVGFGSWAKNIDSLGADVVFVQFGQMESLQGAATLDGFIASYKKLLNEIKRSDRQIILISPGPFEPGRLALNTGNPLTGIPVERYVEQVKVLAETDGYGYLDIFHPLLAAGELTSNGVHLTDDGQRSLASIIVRELNRPRAFTPQLEPLRQEVIQKNVLWFNYWRPGNWAFLYGDRVTVPFSHDWKDKSKRIFPEEMKSFEYLIRDAEKRIGEKQATSAALN